MILGARPHAVRPYGIPSDLEAGSIAAGLAAGRRRRRRVGRLIWLTGARSTPAGPEESQRLCPLLRAGGGGQRRSLRTRTAASSLVVRPSGALCGLRAAAGHRVFGSFFLMESSRRWSAPVVIALGVWAARNLLDNASLVASSCGDAAAATAPRACRTTSPHGHPTCERRLLGRVCHNVSLAGAGHRRFGGNGPDLRVPGAVRPHPRTPSC